MPCRTLLKQKHPAAVFDASSAQTRLGPVPPQGAVSDFTDNAYGQHGYPTYRELCNPVKGAKPSTLPNRQALLAHWSMSLLRVATCALRKLAG